MNTGKTVLAGAASLLLLTLLLLLDKDLLELCQRLVPRLGQGCQGKGRPKQEGAGVDEEYTLDADQAGQVGKCLMRGIDVEMSNMKLAQLTPFVSNNRII